MSTSWSDIAETDCWTGCGPATVLVTGGCVHEHVRRRPACERHLAKWRVRNPLCEPCLFSARSHDCRVSLLDVGPLDPALAGELS